MARVDGIAVRVSTAVDGDAPPSPAVPHQGDEERGDSTENAGAGRAADATHLPAEWTDGQGAEKNEYACPPGEKPCKRAEKTRTAKTLAYFRGDAAATIARRYVAGMQLGPMRHTSGALHHGRAEYYEVASSCDSTANPRRLHGRIKLRMSAPCLAPVFIDPGSSSQRSGTTVGADFVDAGPEFGVLAKERSQV